MYFHSKYMKFRKCVLWFTNAVRMIMGVQTFCCIFTHNEENCIVYNEYCVEMLQNVGNKTSQDNKTNAFGLKVTPLYITKDVVNKAHCSLSIDYTHLD